MSKMFGYKTKFKAKYHQIENPTNIGLVRSLDTIRMNSLVNSHKVHLKDFPELFPFKTYFKN